MEKTEVFGYVRVSTAGQVKEGFSLEQQKEEIVNFCEENYYIRGMINLYSAPHEHWVCAVLDPEKGHFLALFGRKNDHPDSLLKRVKM